MEVKRLANLLGCRLCGQDIKRLPPKIAFVCPDCENRFESKIRIFLVEVLQSKTTDYDPTGVVWELTPEEALARVPNMNCGESRFIFVDRRMVPRLKLIEPPPK